MLTEKKKVEFVGTDKVKNRSGCLLFASLLIQQLRGGIAMHNITIINGD